jgi:hypothetical protein
MSTAHYVRAQQKRREFEYRLAILSAAILSTGSISVEILIVVQISRPFLATLLSTSLLATLLANLTTTSR